MARVYRIHVNKPFVNIHCCVTWLWFYWQNIHRYTVGIRSWHFVWTCSVSSRLALTLCWPTNVELTSSCRSCRQNIRAQHPVTSSWRRPKQNVMPLKWKKERRPVFAAMTSYRTWPTTAVAATVEKVPMMTTGPLLVKAWWSEQVLMLLLNPPGVNSKTGLDRETFSAASTTGVRWILRRATPTTARKRLEHSEISCREDISFGHLPAIITTSTSLNLPPSRMHCQPPPHSYVRSPMRSPSCRLHWQQTSAPVHSDRHPWCRSSTVSSRRTNFPGLPLWKWQIPCFRGLRRSIGSSNTWNGWDEPPDAAFTYRGCWISQVRRQVASASTDRSKSNL